MWPPGCYLSPGILPRVQTVTIYSVLHFIRRDAELYADFLMGFAARVILLISAFFFNKKIGAG
jgi:hypothetical protein